MTCPLCFNPLITKIDEIYYDCRGCGALVMGSKHRLSATAEQARYNTHQNDVEDPRYQKFTSPITNYILQYFSPLHRGLDFGSGSGPVIAKMLQDQNYKVSLYDPFFYPDKTVFDQNYDYIFSCEVFEHLYEPRKEIERLYKILKPGGKLIVMTLLYEEHIEFSNWAYRRDATHVFIYRAKTIEYIAQHLDMEVEILSNRLIVLQKPN